MGKGKKRMHANSSTTKRPDVSQMGLDDLFAADVLDDTHKGDVPRASAASHRDDPSSGASSSDSEGDDDGSDLEFDQEDIERLKAQDPEFYEYLKDTDEGLLDFREDENDLDEEEEEDEEEEDEEDDGRDEGDDDVVAEEGRARTSTVSDVVTSESLKSWCQAAQKNASIGAVRQVTRLYRIACHYGDEDEDESLKLASSAVYNNILLFMLGKADGIFRKALGMSREAGKGREHDAQALDARNGGNAKYAANTANTANTANVKNKADPAEDPTKCVRYAKYAPFIRSYLGNTLHLLDKMTDPSMQGYILKRMRHSVSFLRDFDKIRRKFIALSLKIFASGEDEPRVQGILFVRACAIELPTTCLDPCLKGVYKSFVAASKFFSPSSAPGIRFMATCAVEMYGIDLDATYQHAFVAIKGLAGQMRQALTSKSKESYKEVYCWQTINALELWATVLVAHPVELEPLFYPLIQLLLGACTLIGSPSFIPLRLKCVRMLNELAKARGMYVPVSPVLVEVLQWKDLSKKSKPVPANSIPDINIRLRVGSSILRASSFQEDVVDTTYELLSDHLAQWGSHPGFLEIAHVPLLRLRAFVKSSNKDRFKRGARQLCQAIMETQERVGAARNRAQFGPKDASSISQFLADLESDGPSPISRISKTLREQAVQRMKMRSMEDVVLEDEESEDGDGATEDDTVDDAGEDAEDADETNAKRFKAGGHRTARADRIGGFDRKDEDDSGDGRARGDSEEDVEDYEDKVEQYEFSEDDDV